MSNEEILRRNEDIIRVLIDIYIYKEYNYHENISKGMRTRGRTWGISRMNPENMWDELFLYLNT